MDSQGSTHLIATALVFAVSLVFSMLGLGGAMLYVPIFKWLELPLKTVAIPLGLSALLARRSGGFSRRLPAPRRAPGPRQAGVGQTVLRRPAAGGGGQVDLGRDALTGGTPWT